MKRLTDMIEIISEAQPEFLDPSNKLHNHLYDYVSHLIILSKILCKDSFISKKGIDAFTDNFYNLMTELIDLSQEDDTAEMCWDYINEFYSTMRNYLEVNEEFEVCANFTNFIKTFNEKVDYINEK